MKIEELKETLKNEEAKSELKKSLREDLDFEKLDDEALSRIAGGGRWFLSDDLDVGICETCKTYTFSNKLTGVKCKKCGKPFNIVIKARDLSDDYSMNL
jgi:hypothetical protein